MSWINDFENTEDEVEHTQKKRLEEKWKEHQRIWMEKGCCYNL